MNSFTSYTACCYGICPFGASFNAMVFPQFPPSPSPLAHHLNLTLSPVYPATGPRTHHRPYPVIGFPVPIAGCWLVGPGFPFPTRGVASGGACSGLLDGTEMTVAAGGLIFGVASGGAWSGLLDGTEMIVGWRAVPGFGVASGGACSGLFDGTEMTVG